MNYYIYLILAVGCFVGEVFTMEFSLTCMGIGLLGAGLMAWLGFGLWVQALIFTVVAAVCWVGIRPFALCHLYDKAEHITTPAEEVLGKEALVEIAIDPVKNEGRVKVAGESWKATAETALPVGTVCVVEKLDGVTLTVKQK